MGICVREAMMGKLLLRARSCTALRAVVPAMAPRGKKL